MFYQWGTRKEPKVNTAHQPFFSNLPYSITNSQLEETFNDVGPIRRCFLVTQNGQLSTAILVLFNLAVAEDANCFTELKNDLSLGGQKFAVKHGVHLAPLEQRLSIATQAWFTPLRTRVARTVIFGGLTNIEVAQNVHCQAMEVGTMCSVTYSLPKEELEQHGLAQNGCKMDASAIPFTIVKEARASVAMLHQKEIKGSIFGHTN